MAATKDQMRLAASAVPLESSFEPRTDLTVRLPDGRLCGYAEYGDPDGVPVLGLHGTPGSRFMFRIAHEPARSLGIRLLAPERPGFGISSFHFSRNLETYALDIANFADLLGIGRFAVVGVSGGGPYAAACAAVLGERVTALGLISPIGPMCAPENPSSIGSGHYFAFRLMPRLSPLLWTIFSFGRLAFLHAPNLIFGFIMSRAAPSDWKILSRGDVRRNLLDGVTEGCRPSVKASTQEMKIFSQPWNIPFEKITARAFLWQGLSDRNVPVAAALKLGELIPHCQVHKIKNAGHYWIFDHILEVLEIISKTAKHIHDKPTDRT